MTDSQRALCELVTGFVSSNGRLDLALGGSLIAIFVFWFGWAYRDQMSTWRACSIRVGALLLGLVLLAQQVVAGGSVVDVDHSVTAWLVAHRNPVIDHLALGVTNGLGPVATAGVAVVVAVAVAVWARSVLAGLTIVVTVGGAATMSWLIKRLVGRPRPAVALQETLETDFSFPSGHVTGTAALFGMLAVVAGLGGHRVATNLLIAVAVVAVSAVAVSRLYLGVHWLTDVIAGALLAAATVTVGATTLRSLTDHPEPVTFHPVSAAAPTTALR